MAALRLYIIKNLKTDKEYTVGEDGLKAIKDQGWRKRYTIVEERVVRDAPGTSFAPDEIKELLAGASSDVVSGLKSNKQPRASRH